ncbi:MAG TPA: hypothetical protein VFE37_17315 [Chloroflexota bacterium]|nr:hypothetical protein [Chloroflexota bacterium]
MAKRTPRGRKAQPKRQAAPLRRAASAADLERLLDEVDAALEGGDPARMQTLLEPLWAARERLPEVLTRRLIEGRVAIPAFSFQLLQGFAGPKAATYLRRIAEDRSVPDIVRWGAQRRAGWPARGEAKRRLAFLATLNDPLGALVMATAEAVNAWPPGGEILEEVIGYLAVMPSDQRRAALERLVQELDDAAVWLLHAALHLPDPAAQRYVLGELVRLRDPAAAGPIERLARTTRDTTLRDEATAALQRLGLHVVGAAAPPEPFAFPPVERVLMSVVDGAGAQIILLLRDLGPAGVVVADFLLKEGVGVKDAFGLSHVQPAEIEDIMEQFVSDAVDLVEVDLPAARGALAAAVAVNAATGQALPVKYELWEPLVHDAYPPPADEPITAPELDDTPYADRPDLLRQSGRLADHDFFLSWGFDTPQTTMAMLGSPPPRGGRWTDRQYRPMLEQLMPPPVRAQLRERLRRQAWLLEREGDTASRDVALAVAAALPNATTEALARVPFWRRLVENSVQQFAAQLFDL